MPLPFPIIVALVLGPSSPSSAGARQASAPPTLSLIEAVQLGASQNLDLVAQRVERERQTRAERATWQTYSPTLVLDGSVSRTRAGVDPFGPRALLSYSAGVQWRAPTGTVVGAEALMSHGLRQDAGGHRGGLVLFAQQPLLKDAWLTGAALPLREAALFTELQHALYREALNSLLADVEAAYWDVALAEADVTIKTRSRNRAQQQYEDTAENIRRGILAGVEIYVVEENVVFFEQELLQAQENLRRARARLAELLALPAGGTLTAAQPLDSPSFTAPDADQVLQVALTANPRIQAQRVRYAVAVERERFALNQALPRLDLSASLSTLGVDPQYGAAWGDTFGDPSPEGRVGLGFSLPLDRGAVDAAVDVASLEVQREANRVAEMEQQVRFEIVNGVTDLSTNLALLSLAQKQVDLGELKLAAETEKYRSGISTLADVVRFQRELDNTLIRLQRVRRQVYVGRARLLAAQGTLHEERGVALR